MTIKLTVTLKMNRYGEEISFRGILRYLDTNRQSFERAASLIFSLP